MAQLLPGMPKGGKEHKQVREGQGVGGDRVREAVRGGGRVRGGRVRGRQGVGEARCGNVKVCGAGARGRGAACNSE